MKNDVAIVNYQSLSPKEYSDLTMLQVLQELNDIDDDPSLAIKMELRTQDLTNKSRLALAFTGVTSLKLDQNGFAVIRFPFIEIRSIRENRWEGKYYSVKDEEHELISFYCESFVANLID